MRLKKKKIYIIGVFVFYFILYRREKKDERENKKKPPGFSPARCFPLSPHVQRCPRISTVFFRLSFVPVVYMSHITVKSLSLAER